MYHNILRIRRGSVLSEQGRGLYEVDVSLGNDEEALEMKRSTLRFKVAHRMVRKTFQVRA